MKKLIIGLMVVGIMGMMAGTGMAAATDTAMIDLLISPIVITSLTVSPTYYEFSNVPVAESTVSVSALTLQNDGDIDITVEKEVMSTGDWYITRSSSAKDGFDLWAMVSDNQPTHADFENTFASFSKTGLEVENILPDTGGTQVLMSKYETEKMWFRLDMPFSVSNSNDQKIQVRLVATSQ